MSASVVITNCIPELIALLGLSSIDETRPLLMHARFEVSSERALAIATDGRRIGVLDCDAKLPHGEPPFSVCVMAAELVNMLKAACKTHSETVRVLISYTEVAIEYDGCTVVLKPDELKYPDWRGALSAPVSAGVCTSFNPELAGDFADCDPVGVTATALGVGSPIYMHGESGRFFGVLMPVRRTDGHELAHKVPAWIGGAQ